MLTKEKLWRVFENKPVITKGYAMKRLDCKKYERINPYFEGADKIPGTHKYITEDVIKNILWLDAYGG